MKVNVLNIHVAHHGARFKRMAGDGLRGQRDGRRMRSALCLPRPRFHHQSCHSQLWKMKIRRHNAPTQFIVKSKEITSIDLKL